MHPAATAAIRPENPLTHLVAGTRKQEKLPLGCPILTRLLRGGLPIGSITELSGEAAAGKTQLALHLLLSSLPHPSLYIHSEFPFPLRRLLSLARSDPDPLARIYVAAAHTADDLLAILAHAQSSLLPSLRAPKLLIVDSIAALFRSDFGAADLRRRSGLFFRISSRLMEIAARFRLAVVVTNQVVDVVGLDEGKDGGASGVRVGNYAELWSSGRRVWPALGLSWANCVNMRLFLSRNDEIVRRGEEESADLGNAAVWTEGAGEIVRTRRMIQVVFAPHLPESSAEFVIVKEGVFGVSL